MRHLFMFVAVIAATAVAGEKKVDPIRLPALVDLQNDVCPISGKKIEEAIPRDWGGIRIRLCCPACDKKFLRNPAKALGKLGLKTVKNDRGKPVVDLANAKCPIMGGKTKADVFGDHAGVRVHYCCPMCDKKVKKDPATAFAALGYKYIPSVVDLRNKRCPISGKEIDEETYADRDGVRVRFCCANCVAKFEKDPAPTFKALGVDPAKVVATTKSKGK